mmetsp:Transcript_33414/g.57231  ORF Transcript_33414/g.57231 Transcript_33414/m.57231 type:complete len:94 (-) Transcript_33414:236-517(-)
MGGSSLPPRRRYEDRRRSREAGLAGAVDGLVPSAELSTLATLAALKPDAAEWLLSPDGGGDGSCGEVGDLVSSAEALLCPEGGRALPLTLELE